MKREIWKMRLAINSSNNILMNSSLQRVRIMFKMKKTLMILVRTMTMTMTLTMTLTMKMTGESSLLEDYKRDLTTFNFKSSLKASIVHNNYYYLFIVFKQFINHYALPTFFLTWIIYVLSKMLFQLITQRPQNELL